MFWAKAHLDDAYFAPALKPGQMICSYNGL